MTITCHEKDPDPVLSAWKEGSEEIFSIDYNNILNSFDSCPLGIDSSTCVRYTVIYDNDGAFFSVNCYKNI